MTTSAIRMARPTFFSGSETSSASVLMPSKPVKFKAAMVQAVAMKVRLTLSA